MNYLPRNSAHLNGGIPQWQRGRAAQQEARRLAEIEGELARAKRKREASAKVEGGELGDSDGEGDVDAAEWVRRSRESGGGGKKGGAAGAALRKLEAERRSRLLFEQDRGGDYGAEDLAGACCHSVEDGAARYGRWFGARNASVSPKLANDTKRKKVAASKIVGAMQKWGRFVEVAQTLEQNADGVLETLRLVCLARTNPFEALYANARNAA